MCKQAIILEADAGRVDAYLPANYRVVGSITHFGRLATLIEGTDNAGWTLDGYVLPRLASGLMFGSEVVTEVKP
jgi:hypothetical protein